MRRPRILALVLLLAVAGVAAAVAARHFRSGSPATGGSGTAAAVVTVTTLPSTTTASGSSSSQAAGASAGASASAGAGAAASAGASVSRAAAKFPRAGHLTGNSVVVRGTPSPQGKAIKVLHYFRSDYRVQEILAVGKRIGADHQVWYRISVPMRPNGTYGWIPAGSVKLRATVARIVVNIKRRTLDVYRHGNHVVHATVAVGAPGRGTPRGYFYVTARFVPYHDPFLGVFGLETSAYSHLTEWPGGGVVGIHGTNMPWLLGKAVSHGCVRVSNATAKALKRYVPVGTPIQIKE